MLVLCLSLYEEWVDVMVENLPELAFLPMVAVAESVCYLQMRLDPDVTDPYSRYLIVSLPSPYGEHCEV